MGVASKVLFAHDPYLFLSPNEYAGPMHVAQDCIQDAAQSLKYQAEQRRGAT